MRYSQTRFGLMIAAVPSLMLLAAAVVCGDLRTENREGLARDLTTLALRAQDYYRRDIWEGGGGKSFVGLSATPAGMSRLTTKPATANGVFAIWTAGSASMVELKGLGTQIGNDGQLIVIKVLVFADSTYMTFVN